MSEPVQQIRNQSPLAQFSYGTDCLPGHGGIGINEQRPEQRVKTIGKYAEDPGSFYPGPLTFSSLLVHHPGQNLLCGLEVLSVTGPRQKCHYR